jgi:hypothetical protein
LRAGSRAAALLAVTLALGVGVSAHRRDEYLQAARLDVEPDRIEIDLDLTPGIDVADRIVAAVDRNHDGSLSPDEKRRYEDEVLGALDVELDGRPLRVQLLAASFPGLDTFSHGDGTMHFQSRAVLPPLSAGAHRLLFRNSHRRDVSVYLANALVPESDQVAITGQERDGDQRELTIAFATRPASSPFPMTWLLGGLCAIVIGGTSGWAYRRLV